MKIEQGMYYTQEHEWIKTDGDKAYIGITDYAQEAMGDIVYVELPEVGDALKQKDQCGVLESVKAAADMFMPVSGTVIEVNNELEDSPELLNTSPFETYIFVIEDYSAEELETLMDYQAYKTYCENL
jgi:glycine cleavage system H protein